MIIYTDGLERSGNVFLSYAMSLMLNVEVKSVRSHVLSTLESYKEDYPFVVPLRDALDSIASSKIYRDKKFLDYPELMARYQDSDEIDKSSLELENIIERYFNYTQHLVDNPRFFIAPFNEFTKDASNFMYKLSKHYPAITVNPDITNKDIEKIVSLNSGMFDSETGNLPRSTPKKIEMKKILKSSFLKEIQQVQLNIDKLYKRYYTLP